MNKPIAALLLLIVFGCRGPAPDYLDIRIDGLFDDWESTAPVYAAPEGSPGPVRKVRMADSRGHLFVLMELDGELLLQTDNDLVFHLDLDRDPATGIAVGGIGADFSWRFGKREGMLRLPGRELPINAYQAGLVAAPAVSSARFEFKLAKEPDLEGAPALFSAPGVAWLLADCPEGLAGEDPAAGTYRMRDQSFAPYPEIPIARPEEPHLRVVSYNVLWNGHILRPEPFRRILRALDPDVIAFQEVARKTSEEATRGLVEEWLGGGWHSRRVRDCVTVSRFPIVATASEDGNLLTLIDLPDADYPRDILIANCHLPSGGKHRARAEEISRLLSFLDRARRGEGTIPLPPGTPFVILGDMNLVGPAGQLRTLKEGEGEKPDWDSTSLADLHPCHSAAPRSYTWRSPERTGFGPSRIDYVLYTDSVLAPVRSFVLATDSMDPANLERHGLKREDAVEASDHYPVVADFQLFDR